MALTLDGEPLTAAEARRILASAEPLALIRGKWVEVDADKLREVLDHWKKVEAGAAAGLSFLEGMRLLAGARIGLSDAAVEEAAAWTRVTAGPWLDELLARAREPRRQPRGRPRRRARGHAAPLPARGRRVALAALPAAASAPASRTTWASARRSRCSRCCSCSRSTACAGPTSSSCPASLLGNWRAEARRFAPRLSRDRRAPLGHERRRARLAGDVDGTDVILTTYGTVLRVPWLKERQLGPRRPRRGAGDQERGHEADPRREGAREPTRASRSRARRSRTASAISGRSSTSSARASSAPPAPSASSPRSSRPSARRRLRSAPDPRPPVHPAPDEERQAHHRRPARQDRGPRLLLADEDPSRPLREQRGGARAPRSTARTTASSAAA